MKVTYVSRAGKDMLYKKYLEMDTQISEAHKKMGESAQMDKDLAENSEYMSLRVEAMYTLPKKKHELLEKFRNAIIIEDMEEYKNFDGKTVIRGSEVKLLFGGEEVTYKILGCDEGDCDNGIIACDAPLAELILHKHVGETTQLNGMEIYIISVQRV